MMRRGVYAGLLALLLAATTSAQDGPYGILNDVGFDQKLDAVVPSGLLFLDSTGAPVRLGDYLGEKPVVLNLVYFECPMLCTLVMDGLTRAMRAIAFDAGEEYEVLSVSFDPAETPAIAAVQREAYRNSYGRGDAGWRFLTGQEEAIRQLAGAVGFRYAWDEASGQWAHPSGLVVLTPEGRVSKYLYGIEYSARDLRLALVDAASGGIGSPVDQLLLYCFHYDPATGRYGFVVMNAIRLLGLATIGGLGLFIALALRRERASGGEDAR